MIYEKIATDGEVITISVGYEPTLEEIQKAVGGYYTEAQCVVPDGKLFVNEEGLLLGLPINEIATCYLTNGYIVGDVLLASPKGIVAHFDNILGVEEE